jgi:hypothetical protein
VRRRFFEPGVALPGRRGWFTNGTGLTVVADPIVPRKQTKQISRNLFVMKILAFVAMCVCMELASRTSRELAAK